VQTRRELDEDEVQRINYIVKRRATRYVAAAEHDWLYPEDHLQTTHWGKLDHDWFLRPNPYKVSFSTGFFAGGNKGTTFASDENGRRPSYPKYNDRKQEAREFITAQRGKVEWALMRKGKSVSRDSDTFDDVEDKIMAEDIEKYERAKP
jgi:photosystem II stability/assembly factor-like uncharacterized protein